MMKLIIFLSCLLSTISFPIGPNTAFHNRKATRNEISFINHEGKECSRDTQQMDRRRSSTTIYSLPMIHENEPNANVEDVIRAWKSARRPMLRISDKNDLTLEDGKMLKQLLDNYSLVKVKIDRKLDMTTMEEAFESLKNAAQVSGASSEMEMIHTSVAESFIFFGNPGTLSEIQSGSFESTREGKGSRLYEYLLRIPNAYLQLLSGKSNKRTKNVVAFNFNKGDKAKKYVSQRLHGHKRITIIIE